MSALGLLKINLLLPTNTLLADWHFAGLRLIQYSMTCCTATDR